jgi:8-oxo-dGTP pyrophosphatase MutT (NUDIX family)
VLSRRQVRAAGGAVLRPREGGGVEICVVHRPKYDDWSLPKGKLDRGETFEQAAVREVLEETGLRCRLRQELEEVRYTDSKGRPKLVRYWVMDVAEDTGFTPSDEVDELRWLELPAAAALLTYQHDQELVASLVSGRPGP